METKHTPTPWDTTPTAGDHDQHIIWNDAGKTIAVVHTNKADAALIVRAVNSHAALIRLARSVIAQDEFTFTDDTPSTYKDAARIINAWREKARAALELAKCS